MRLFYQSFGVSRSSRDGRYGQVLKRILDQAVAPETEIVINGLSPHRATILSGVKSLYDIIEVDLNSPGGKVLPAMAIGNIIRDNWLWTSLADSPHAVCYSSCVLLYVAGAVRIEPDYYVNLIGIHRPFFDAELFAGLSQAEAKKKYDALLNRVKLYVDKMGVSAELYQAMVQIPSNELRNLTPDEIKNWNVSGNDPGYMEYKRAQNLAKYGEAKMREFDEWRRITEAYIQDCEQRGWSPEMCTKEAFSKFPNPIPQR